MVTIPELRPVCIALNPVWQLVRGFDHYDALGRWFLYVRGEPNEEGWVSLKLAHDRRRSTKYRRIYQLGWNYYERRLAKSFESVPFIARERQTHMVLLAYLQCVTEERMDTKARLR